MADFFTEVKTIVLSNLTKTEKIHKLVNDLKCTRNEAERFYAIVQCVQGKPEREATTTGAPRRRFTVGVEIECFGLNKQEVKAALEARRIQSIVTGYDHNDQKKAYKLGHDGSIDGCGPCEVVSPVLRSLNSLKAVCEVLNECGAQVNRSCGLHVHFGAANFTLNQWQRIIINYANIEPVIDSFLAPSRRGNNNCFSRSIITAAESLAGLTVNSFDQIRGALNYDRYHKVNAEAYARHKTIEFRQHHGTTSFEKIDKWVGFLGALINYSIDHTEPIQATTIDDLPFLSAAQKRYFNKRKNSFNE